MCHDDIWGIRRIVLVPFEEDVCDVDYLDKSAKDVLILPGREKMCTDANGVFSLPQIEVARTKREVRRGMVRKSDIQLEQPVKIVWHDRVVEVQEFTIIDIPGQRVRSVIKVSQVSLILSHMVNNWND